MRGRNRACVSAWLPGRDGGGKCKPGKGKINNLPDMRRKLVAGNWKMNKTFQEAEELFDELADSLKNGQEQSDVEVVVCPPSVYLEMAHDLGSDEEDETQVFFSVGAQNVNEHASGAYTGEISAPMLASMGVEYCIVGHSERRRYYGETDSLVASKVESLLQCGISPIVCIGETLEEREAGKQFETVERQLKNGLFHLQPLDFVRLVIAYEPVWAIGTGKTATPAQAQEIHAHIRNVIQEQYGKAVAATIPLLYGGSCNARTAPELFAQADIDGGLIGGASLQAEEFLKIVNSFD